MSGFWLWFWRPFAETASAIAILFLIFGLFFGIAALLNGWRWFKRKMYRSVSPNGD